MKILAISDTHCRHEEIDLSEYEADVIVHAGDATLLGEIPEVSEFSVWWNSLPYRHKIIVPGNHDFLFQDQPGLAKSMFLNTHVLINEGVEIEGLFFYGTPIVKHFGPWAFGYYNEKREEFYDLIPDQTEVLITHQPPFGRLDYLPNGTHLGCEILLDRVLQLNKLKAHIFGHIHSGHGIIDKKGVTVVNAAQLDNSYTNFNEPIVFEI